MHIVVENSRDVHELHVDEVDHQHNTSYEYLPDCRWLTNYLGDYRRRIHFLRIYDNLAQLVPDELKGDLGKEMEPLDQ